MALRFWLRELAGWALVGLGLYVFLICFATLLDPAPKLLEAGPLTVIGFILFRGGIHLLKVAVAARVCMHAQGELARRQTRAHSPKEPDTLPDW
jgi:hypothetical protein